jgi:uncharacterized phage-associated protein
MSIKSLSVAQRLLEDCAEVGAGAVTPMQLIKLAYIAHGLMLGKHGAPLLDECVEAWEYGPVVPSVYRAVKRYKSSPVGSVDGADREFTFSADEAMVMKLTAKTYGNAAGTRLSAATHKPGTPWTQTWSKWGRNADISNDLIEDFYRRLLGQGRHSAL